METADFKRAANKGIEPQHENSDIASLSTLGMRIRKSVADGYNVPSNKYNGYNAYDRMGYTSHGEYGRVEPKAIGIFGGNQDGSNIDYEPARVPLPTHMSQPPALTNAGSTIGTCSNLSEWENNYASHAPPISTLGVFDQGTKGKRKFDDIDEDAVTYGSGASAGYGAISGNTNYDMGTEYYRAKYGELKFDEDF